jgi:hypothetical protein
MQVQRSIRRAFRRKPIANPRNPRARGICQGCGLECYRDEMQEQRDYRGGSAPVPTGVWKCRRCIDVPQPYFKKQVLPPDPVPVRKPFPDDGADDGEEFPTYESGSLPAPGEYPAGYRIDVESGGETIPAYSDTLNWRRYDTNAVIT